MTDLEYCAMYSHLDARSPDYLYNRKPVKDIGPDDTEVSDRSFDWHENPMDDML
jgi:hypothetical protein